MIARDLVKLPVMVTVNALLNLRALFVSRVDALQKRYLSILIATLNLESANQFLITNKFLIVRQAVIQVFALMRPLYHVEITNAHSPKTVA